MTRRTPAFASIALLLVVAVITVACSNPRETGDTEEVSEEGPITIGASLSLSGEYARIAVDQHNAYKLWVKQINESGGLLGRQVELTVLDDRSSPETGARLYERLITEEDVDLIMGPYSSAVTGGMMNIAERYEMVNIAPMGSADELFQQGAQYSFQVITPASHYLDGALDFMEEAGLKSFVVVGEDSAFPAALLAGLEDVADERGFELLYSELYPVGTRDFSAIIGKIEEAQPDAIMGGTYAEDAVAFTQQLKEQGVDAPIIALTVGAAENEYWESVGDAGQHIMGASHWEPGLDTPGNEEFVEAYTDEYEKDPGYHAAGSYAGMQILGEAVEACECFDHQQIREELIDMETETVFGEFDVDENGAQVGKIGVMVQWFDGKKEIVWPDDQATADWVEFTPWSER
ncbi:MAG: ABC transporter substrate-binding protein [Actinobacteria bacterium]|nr:ABC transporter substrate-binding protein [Actinomycetota bacterium]